jgi:YD repeat-containing protein
MPDYYKEPGLYPNRDYVNQHPEERIDPFTGLLQYHYVDIFIPGNGGFHLKVERSYSAPQDAVNFGVNDALGMKTFAGVGWTMHFGRVLSRSGSICQGGSTTTNPVLELPDGSRHILVNTFSGGQFLDYLTTDRWKGSCDANGNMTVWSPDGVRYRMDYLVRNASPSTGAQEQSLYPTEIRDRNDNTITIAYRTQNPWFVVLIDSVTTSDGRSLTYSYLGEGTEGVRLDTITTRSGVKWSYGYTLISSAADGQTFYKLTTVTRPDGSQWRYFYNDRLSGTAGSYALSSVTYPQGGTINYGYAYKQFDPALNQNTVISSKVANPGGNYTYTYTPGVSYDQTIVNAPEGTYTYRHFGAQAATNGTVWKIGLLLHKSLGNVQSEDYSWSSLRISTQPYDRGFGGKLDNDTEAPILTAKVIGRDGASYSTTYSNYDSYGNPQTITESGSANRSNTLTYNVVPSKWIIHDVKNESRTAGLITRGFDGNGNVTSISKYGVNTSFGRTAAGDISSVTDARLNTTNFSSYVRGIPQSESRPESITVGRMVDLNGNVTSETDGAGNTRGYGYDGLNRLTSINMPIGADVNISYGIDSRTLSRGAFREDVIYDGFGRPLSVTRGGITTTMQYDQAGRRIFQSYPGATPGITYGYDILGRITSMSFAGGGEKIFTYAAYSFSVKNERLKTTTYSYASYGDPDERYVTNIAAPDTSAAISILRNANNQITQVTQAAQTRTFGYDSRYFLTSEGNPETGPTTYGRDAVGNMTSKAVGTFGQIAYSYDGLNRLQTITYPAGGYSSTPSVTLRYNGNNQETTANSSVANRTNAYDGNGNLTSEQVTVDGLTFATSYGYDSLDNLNTITYPGTLTLVTYAPDALGHPTKAIPFVTSVAHFASGNVSSLAYANGVTSSFTENARQFYDTARYAKAATVFGNYSYGYDDAGNLTSITNSVGADGPNWTLTYDDIDRLVGASGAGGGSIAYDGAGNITSYTFAGINRTFTYSANRLSDVSGSIGRSYSYDAAGNVTNNGVNSFQYDGASNLRCVGCTATATTYEYDAKNLRIKKSKNGSMTYSIYSNNGNLLTEYDPVGQTYTEYIYVDKKVVARHIKSNMTPTTTALTADPVSTRPGVPIALSATVTGASPTGSVTFKDGPAVLTTKSLSGGGASYDATFSTTGRHDIVASYSGDIDDRASDSNPLTVTVELGETTSTALSLSGVGCSGTCVAGTAITLQATVTGSTAATGNVLFKNGTALLGQAPLTKANSNSAQASYQISDLAPGTYTVTAEYQGDNTHQTSVSSGSTLTITKTITSVTLAASLNPSLVNQGVTFTGTLANAYGPSGTMSFKDGGTTLGTTPITGAVASFVTNSLAVGTHSITALYSGDSFNGGSTSSPLSQTVNKVQTTTVCSAFPSGAVKDTQTLSVTASVSGISPSGSATLYVDSIARVSQSLVNGVTTFSVRGLTVGSRAVSVSYTGDGNNASSSCAPITVPVTFDPALLLILNSDD